MMFMSNDEIKRSYREGRMMSEIDCGITENFLKELSRMCDSCMCSECPIGQLDDELIGVCRHMMFEHPAETIAIVQKWSDEHPVKTILDDFLEKHPNAPKAATGTPLACAWRAGYLDEDGCLSGRCTECWNKPLSEV